MDVTLIYFSQTGNTRRIAEAIAEIFRTAGHITRLVSLKKASPLPLFDRLSPTGF